MSYNKSVQFGLILLFLLPFNAGSDSDWPDNIDQIQGSLCIVEFFQPQFEFGEIEDKSRIKKKMTGILVTDNGLVLTSDMIYPASLDIMQSNLFYIPDQAMPEDITVSFERDKKLKAKFIGKDEELRIAFIKIIDKSALPEPVEFSNNEDFTLGQQILFIQHLNDRFDHEKIISAHHINSIIEKPRKKLLSTCGYTPLSAGGLTLDSEGNAIGVIYRSEMYYPHYEYEFNNTYSDHSLVQITPAAQLVTLIKEPPQLLIQRKSGGKSWLGVQMQILSKEMAQYWDITDKNGIIVNKVLPGSPAEKGGLKAGDIILSFGDLKIKGYDKKNMDILRDYVRELPESQVVIEILRDKKPMNISVQLESAPKSRFLADEYSDELLGLGVKELTRDYIINNDLDFDTEGVWVSRVEDGGSASIAGIDVNDLILSINDQPVNGLDDFKTISAALDIDKPEYIQIFLKRQGKTQFVYIKAIPDKKI